MIWKTAPEAKSVMTVTFDGRDGAHEIFLLDTTADSVDAIWRWTPLEVVFVVYVCSCEEFLIPVMMLAGS